MSQVADRTVLLTGATGLLGTWLRRTAPAGTTVVPLIHRTQLADERGVVADLRDAHAVADAVARVRPDVVIHAAYAHDRESIVDATRHVVDAVAAMSAHLVHVSTDAVFAGDGTPRSETDSPDPVWDYGRWKADAEQLVAGGSASASVVRLPLIVSLDPADHVVARIRDGAARRRPTHWFDDEVRQPAAAPELAAAIWDVASLDPERGAGVWHLPGPERETRAAIARRVVAALGLVDDVITVGPTPSGAGRPRDLHLLDERARRVIGWAPTPILDGAGGARSRFSALVTLGAAKAPRVLAQTPWQQQRYGRFEVECSGRFGDVDDVALDCHVGEVDDHRCAVPRREGEGCGAEVDRGNPYTPVVRRRLDPVDLDCLRRVGGDAIDNPGFAFGQMLALVSHV